MDSTQSKAKLFSKIAQVMLAVRTLSKDGVNTFDKYGYVTADSAFEYLGKAMATVNLVALPSILECEQTEVASQAGKAQTRTIVHGQITLACGDTGETWTNDWWGEAIDRSDKSINKAVTSMTKYHLVRLFNVGTGEDADADSPEIERPTAQKSPQRTQPAQAANRTAEHRNGAQRPTQPAIKPTTKIVIADDVDFGGGEQWDDIPDAATSDARVASSAAGLLHSDVPMTELASRLIIKCHELDKASGDKALSTENKAGGGSGQYGLLAGKIDRLTKKDAHGPILSALTGVDVSKENPPGWKLKELIDWMQDDNAAKASTEQAIKDVWAAL